MNMSRRTLLQQGQAPPLVQRQPCYQNSPAPHTVAARSTQQSTSLQHLSSLKSKDVGDATTRRHYKHGKIGMWLLARLMQSCCQALLSSLQGVKLP